MVAFSHQDPRHRQFLMTSTARASSNVPAPAWCWHNQGDPAPASTVARPGAEPMQQGQVGFARHCPADLTQSFVPAFHLVPTGPRIRTLEVDDKQGRQPDTCRQASVDLAEEFHLGLSSMLAVAVTQAERT